MPADTLNLDTIELTTTERRWPANGAPSSSDYNSTVREILNDLASVTDFINNTLRPVLNALPADAATGLEGRTVIADTLDKTPLFFDTVTGKPLSVAESLRLLYGMVQNAVTRVSDLALRLTTLDSKLSTTNQNDVSALLQSFSESLTSLTTGLAAQQEASTDLLARVSRLESASQPQ